MPHPGKHGSFCPLLDRNALGSRDRAAANRRGMIGDGSCDSVAKIGIIFMKRQEAGHGPKEIFDVLGLGLHTSASIGFLTFGETISGSLDFKFNTDAVDGRC